MPLVKIMLPENVDVSNSNEVMQAVSRVVADATGKPERYIMVTLSQAAIMMAGEACRGAFLDVRGIGGMSPTVNARITQDMCELLNDQLGLDPEAVYITFTDVAATNWGWDGHTFG
jgi:phenylpyruvate tautomerase